MEINAPMTIATQLLDFVPLDPLYASKRLRLYSLIGSVITTDALMTLAILKVDANTSHSMFQLNAMTTATALLILAAQLSDVFTPTLPAMMEMLALLISVNLLLDAPIPPSKTKTVWNVMK